MDVPSRGRRKRVAIACLVAVAVAATALAYLSLGGGPKAPVFVMAPPEIFVAPGMTVDYGLLSAAPGNQTGFAQLSASAPAGLAVGLSTSSVSIQHPEPVEFTVTASAEEEPGDYVFHLEVTAGQSRAAEAFGVDVVAALVTIQYERFQPPDLNVTTGTEVTWINLDTTIGCCDPGYHTVAFTSGISAASPVLERFDTWNYTFDQAGTFDYHCTIHPFMLGAVNVQG